MKKVLFFVASLLVVTACNNANNERVNETSGENAAVETRACDEYCDEDSLCGDRECEERCDERHDNCDGREDCTVHHEDECSSRRNCDSRHSRHSDCRDSRHNSRHCEDRC